MVPDTSALRQDAEWSAMIAQLGERKALLVSDFTQRFSAPRLYRGLVPTADIDSLVSDTMEMYLQLLAGEQIAAHLQRLPADLGRRRARQGVPLELLLEGVRTNSRVIWNALRQIAGDDSALALVRNTDTVLSLVEWHAREVQASYLGEREVLNRHSEQRRRRAMAELFSTADPSPEQLTAWAVDLGVSAEATFDVVVQLGPHAEECSLCARSGWAVLAHDLAHDLAHGSRHERVVGTCHVVPVGRHREASSLAPAGLVAGVDGLRHLPQAARAALVVARHLGPGPARLATVSEVWPAVAWGALLPLIAEDLLPIRLGALRALSPTDRTRLVETVMAYCATGSVKATAEELYCHRNTIIKRLDRFAALTGADVTVPDQAAIAVPALRALGPREAP